MYCGRTEKTLNSMLETIVEQYSDDGDLHALLSESAGQSYRSQPFRGFTLLNHGGDTVVDIQVGVCSTNLDG